jgi:hypothetical protein
MEMDGKHKYQFRVTRTVQSEVLIEVEGGSLTEAYMHADRYAQLGQLPPEATIKPLANEVLGHQLMMTNPLAKGAPAEERVLH